MELLKIPGLAPGANLTRGTSQCGYVLFVRQGPTDTDETVEEAIFRFADEYQVRPFIKHIRERVFDWNGEPESLTREMQVALSADGALGQYKYMTSVPNIVWCANNLVIRTKGHASRTSVEQMSDLAQKYAKMKKILKKKVEILGASLSFRKVIADAIRANGHIKLVDTKKNLILDTLCKMPEFCAETISAADNCKAFRKNGQNVDGRPHYVNMLNTCIRDLTDAEEQLLWKHLPKMIQLVDKPELNDMPQVESGKKKTSTNLAPSLHGILTNTSLQLTSTRRATWFVASLTLVVSGDGVTASSRTRISCCVDVSGNSTLLWRKTRPRLPLSRPRMTC